MKQTLPLVLAASLTATCASAETISDHVEVDGYVELSYVIDDTTSEEDLVVAGDVDIVVSDRALGFGLPIGFSMGIKGVAADEGGSAHAIYPAVTYRFIGVGTLAVGAPRSVYDRVVPSKQARVFNFFSSGESRQAFDSAIDRFALNQSRRSYGVSFVTDVRPFVVGASYNQMENGSVTYESLAVSASFTYDDWYIAAAYEDFTENDTSDRSFRNYKVGGGINWGEYETGVSYSNYSANFGVPQDAYEAFFTYRPTAAIDLTAVATDYSFDSDLTIGLSGKYTFRQKAYGELAAITGPDGEIYQMNVGWDF